MRQFLLPALLILALLGFSMAQTTVLQVDQQQVSLDLPSPDQPVTSNVAAIPDAIEVVQHQILFSPNALDKQNNPANTHQAAWYLQAIGQPTLFNLARALIVSILFTTIAIMTTQYFKRSHRRHNSPLLT